ncbi:lipopolysaccharide assembly protein LapB [Providencia manganoxydans]|uniref:Lipopolysaccharide assembly protein B n=1 Tax=Providencia manganoxydans TaxID=2923283 RepID=A0ABX7AAW8_9GAMM|nr:lipopolysaccharide assembly protein LapB [Providencia manganoxydans]MDX4944451.1 lipopolysaccharide assembly protein LapB [Providencia manganoxydans]QQO60643.1 lipopolysaccharide assembly protein LapB [Providencia manganoxydans]HEF8772569.1 lipopolysaccharide assembly protein LapB [Providencia stuartii]
MFELLFLLLPIAAAYGWYMGRRSAQQDKQQHANRLSRDYVTGVNFLLSNQQDKAVDLFLDMLKEDSSAFEAHLTLGNLFRSRGEVERAIRIHQSLVESAALSFEQRLLATQQLGRDYMAAGVYDRAENMFQQLTDEVDFKQSALQSLLSIFQLTSEWTKAIETATKLVKLGNEELRENIAHFYCELAIQHLGSDDLDGALSLLNKAEQADKNCARVSIMKGRIFIEQSHYEKAIAVLKQVYEQDRELVAETLPLLHDCYHKVSDIDAWEAYLRQCVAGNTGAIAELYLADIIVAKQSHEAAASYINDQIQRHPTMRLFYRLMDYHLQEAEEGRAKESLILLRKMVGEQIRTKPDYRCHKCGFTSHSLYWHCPSCRSWDTIKPIRGLDGQ